MRIKSYGHTDKSNSLTVSGCSTVIRNVKTAIVQCVRAILLRNNIQLSNEHSTALLKVTEVYVFDVCFRGPVDCMEHKPCTVLMQDLCDCKDR